MRGRDKIRIWPLYFDARNTTSEGRRVPLSLAIRNPKLGDIESAANELDLNPISHLGMAHPRFPWKKTGVVLLDKKSSKTRMLDLIAKKMKENRG